MANKVVYFEVPADDMARAGKFYGGVFGWEVKEMGDGYTSIQCAEPDEYMHSREVGTITGGIQARGERAVAPTVVIQTDNMDELISKIEASGGVIKVPKEKMMEMGDYAQFEDSEGNRIGLFQPKK